MSAPKNTIFANVTVRWREAPVPLRWGLVVYGALALGHYGFSSYAGGVAELHELRSAHPQATPDKEYRAVVRGCSKASIWDSLVLPYTVITEALPHLILRAHPK